MVEESYLKALGVHANKDLLGKLEADHQKVDQFMMRLLWIHWAVASTLMGYAHGFYLLGFVAGGVICGVAYLATSTLSGTVYPRVIMGVSLMLFMSLFVQQSLGKAEMHFHFFMSLAILVRYKSLLPLATAATVATIHHAIWSYCQATGVEVFSTPLVVFELGSSWGTLLLHYAFGFATVGFLMLIINDQTRQFCQLSMSSKGVADVLDTLLKSKNTSLRMEDDHEHADIVNSVLDMMNQQVANTQALKNANAALVIVDTEDRVVFINDRGEALLTRLCLAGNASVPSEWMGVPLSSICQIGGMAFNGSRIEGTVESLFCLDEHRIKVITEPVDNEQHVRLGAIVEWVDVSAQSWMQSQVKDIVGAAKRGDLSQRIPLSEKDELFTPVAVVINELLTVYEQFVNDTMRVFSGMAGGDLSQGIQSNSYEGKFAQLQQDANQTLNRLIEVVTDIHQVSGGLTHTSNELSQTNSGLAQRTEEQAAGIEQTAATLEQMTASVRQSADHAQLVSQSAAQARERINQSQQIVSETVTTMQAVSDASKKVLGITSLMNELSFQTNLLSLNAAVEAARAGEHGRGFAVVASEVRNLALRSSEASKEIEQLINNSVDQVQQGSKSVHRSSEAMSEVIQSVAGVTDLIDEIALAAQEQSNGIGQINQALARLESTTQQNASMVNDTQQASEEMTRQAQQLNQMVTFFKMGEKRA